MTKLILDDEIFAMLRRKKPKGCTWEKFLVVPELKRHRSE